VLAAVRFAAFRHPVLHLKQHVRQVHVDFHLV
jgi:hypothetical protein